MIVLYIHSQSTIFYFNNCYCSWFFYCRLYIYIYFYDWETQMDVLNFLYVQYCVNIFFQTKQEVYLFPRMSLGVVFSPLCNAACFLSHYSTQTLRKWKQSWQKATLTRALSSNSMRLSVPHMCMCSTHWWREAIYDNLDLWECLHISSVEAVPYIMHIFIATISWTVRETENRSFERSILFCVLDIFGFIFLCCNTICHI